MGGETEDGEDLAEACQNLPRGQIGVRVRFATKLIRYPSESRKVDVRLPGEGNSNTHGARPIHLIITMIKLIRTSRLSITNSLSDLGELSPPTGVTRCASLRSHLRVEG